MRRRWALTIFATLAATSAQAADIQGVMIAPEVDATYSRTMYGNWRDEDGDCQNTRDEVLIAESLAPVTLREDSCKVTAGLWFDPYTGMTFTVPGDLDIDHFVPLKEAHQSGGHAWDTDRRRQYANDLSNPGHLIAVDDSTNQSKGDRDPAEWLPPNQSFRCAYVMAWLAVKRTWGLTADQAEANAIQAVLDACQP